MEFGLTEDERAWRDEVRGFLATAVTPELREGIDEFGTRMDRPHTHAFRWPGPARPLN